MLLAVVRPHVVCSSKDLFLAKIRYTWFGLDLKQAHTQKKTLKHAPIGQPRIVPVLGLKLARST